MRGAERLATPDPQDYHRSLSGPSLEQGWAEEAARGQLVWVEGSVKEMAQRTDSTVQRYFEIPQNLRVGYKPLLMATQADWERGAVRGIRCRLCRQAKFHKWADYKRHCDCTETHPLSIHFCNDCGEYFARSDSCQRRYENRPGKCIEATPEEAEAKRSTTQREHDAFRRRVREFLTTREEDIGMSFSNTMKDLYPSSSKKRISRE